MKTAVQGGYVLITVGQLANVCAARKEGAITFLALRVWLATLEQRARRCFASKTVRYSVSEIRELMGSGVTDHGIESALRALARAGFLQWSKTGIDHGTELTPSGEAFASLLGTNHRRRVPIPRRVLRALFRHKRPSEVLAALGHLIRCLFKHGSRIANYGLVKASWIASVFGIAERSVHSARRWLIKEQFLTQERVHQLVMNRWGGKFVVNLGGVSRPSGGDDFAPPIQTKSTYPNQSTYDQTKHLVQKPSGVFGKHFSKPELRAPTLKNILPEDLKQLPRLEELYRQAIAANWLVPCDANFRNFVCAALRATRSGGRVGAIFIGIVRRRLWHHITSEQEARALGVLRRYRLRAERNCGAVDEQRMLSKGSELVRTVLKSFKPVLEARFYSTPA